MVLLALNAAKFASVPIMRASLNWLMNFQCRNGGWAAFDKNVQNPVLQYLPFADHNAILDPACPDITGRVWKFLENLELKSTIREFAGRSGSSELARQKMDLGMGAGV
jgi:squalene-hopene/tetraprenyl-beta-curcumene cyclase